MTAAVVPRSFETVVRYASPNIVPGGEFRLAPGRKEGTQQEHWT